ncbi:hypothetical protein SAMN05421823_103537 [Catalinimonas alkaloidigena]|uniref:Glycosyltransferase RgtA/B/C/D-like domain-containing protein n=1 Tax=Catalinimonas alkaloidigena TaxID=1075417 RepID=A0A1G9ENY2_9BACT|nr:DUF6427 family protein [Catalinimonas alkaloidigena]SDK77798.1 hypothetical protein SAMN05421823_103537 [Catalinimonas alkaloidigena]
MISFFKTISPLRLVALLVILVGLRLPWLLGTTPLTVTEVGWMVVGEKVSHGAVMYRDVWDTTAPLASVVYGLLHTLFGKSQLAFQWAALVLVAVQAFLFNRYMDQDDVYPDRTSLPGLMYVLVSSLFFDFLTLSPALMAVTFLLPALHRVFRHIRLGLEDDDLFFIGLFVGIAALFHLPILVFLALPILAFLLYSGTTARQYVLILIGAALPIAIAFLYYYWYDAALLFYRNYWATLLSLASVNFAEYQTLAIIFGIPVLLMLAGALMMSGNHQYTNYQSICQQIMVMWVIGGVAVIFFDYRRTPSQFMVLVPAAAYFITHVFVLARKRWQYEAGFGVLVLAVVASLYGPQWMSAEALGPLDDYLVERSEDPARDIASGKRVLVLGDALVAYQDHALATPYLDWNLAKKHLHGLDTYRAVVDVYENFVNDPPDVIIDQEEMVPQLFFRIPTLREQYQPSGQPGVYVRTQTAARGL